MMPALLMVQFETVQLSLKFKLYILVLASSPQRRKAAQFAQRSLQDRRPPKVWIKSTESWFRSAGREACGALGAACRAGPADFQIDSEMSKVKIILLVPSHPRILAENEARKIMGGMLFQLLPAHSQAVIRYSSRQQGTC